MDLGSGRDTNSYYDYLARWILLEGNRLLLTGGVVLGFFLLTLFLVSYGIISVGPQSPIQSILGSGVVAGLFSLISVTLAINQLISSRVFGTLDQLQDKLEGGNDLRNTVSEIADHPSPPIRIANFIAFVGETLQERAESLPNDHDFRDDAIQEQIQSYSSDLTAYAETVQQISGEMPAEKVIATLAGPDFAYHLNQTDELRSKQHENLTKEEREILDTIADLLGLITIFRQYYKTIALHQELAQLSRQFIFVGLPAVIAALLAPLLYKTNSPVALTSYPHELVIVITLAIVITPLVLLMAYMLRIATIFRYTVSVAPFVPPVEWPWSE